MNSLPYRETTIRQCFDCWLWTQRMPCNSASHACKFGLICACMVWNVIGCIHFDKVPAICHLAEWKLNAKTFQIKITQFPTYDVKLDMSQYHTVWYCDYHQPHLKMPVNVLPPVLKLFTNQKVAGNGLTTPFPGPAHQGLRTRAASFTRPSYRHTCFLRFGLYDPFTMLP